MDRGLILPNPPQNLIQGYARFHIFCLLAQLCDLVTEAFLECLSLLEITPVDHVAPLSIQERRER
jgi:hypothetical protein